MPGTIQVRVMDFMGPQSSSQTSEIYVKVSMGKREYKTWDAGNFSFPLTTLRDNLVVALKDANGNDISCTVISTRMVVEKGEWDDIFILEEGAQVHLKFQFILTEEELERIRMMRESALKKKRELKSGIQSPQGTTSADSDVASFLSLNNELPEGRLLQTETVNINKIYPQAGQLSSPVNSFKTTKSITENVGSPSEDQNQQASNDAGDSKATNLSYRKSQLENIHQTEARLGDSVRGANIQEEKRINKSERSLAGKNVNNVRKMVSAFEGGLTQDTSHYTKPPLKRFQSNKIGIEAFFKNQNLENINTNSSGLTELMSGRAINPLSEVKFSQALTKGGGDHFENNFEVTDKEVNTEEGNNCPEDLNGTSAIGHNATTSGRASNKKHNRGGPYILLYDEKIYVEDPFNKRGRKVHMKQLRENMQRTSNNIPKSIGYFDDKKYFFEISGTWVLPEGGRRLCVTTGGKQVMDLMNSFNMEEKCNQEELEERTDGDTVPGRTEETISYEERWSSFERSDDAETSEGQRTSSLERLEDAEKSKGPIRQVIKVAIMIGFGTLVLLTRQRQSR